MSTSLTVDVFLKATKNENDWSTLGIFLNVPQSELKAIEEEKLTVLHRKTELFLRWSKISKPNWSDLISALRTMSNISLADELTEKYLKSPEDTVSVQTSLPISPSTMASSLSPPPTTVPLSVDTITLPQTSALQLSPPHSGSETEEDIFMDTLQQTEEKPGCYHILLDKGIATEFSRLDAKLIRMASKIKSALKEKDVSIEELQDFITDYCMIDPIPPELATITNVVTKKRLNYSCDNCDILQHVVSNFLDGTRLKTDIAKFIEEVEKFKSSTSIKSLLQVVLKVANEVSGYVIIKVEKYWGDRTIKQFEKMVKSLFRKYFKYFTQMQVTDGCYCISYTVHKHYAACLHIDLPTNTFLTLIGIISIYIDGTNYFQRETKGSLTLDSALCNAIESHNVYAVELLLAVGASTIIPYKSGQPVIDIVKDMSGVFLMTVLHVASANNHIDVVSSLIEAGCDRNKQNSFGWTALMLAVKGGATAVTKHLLEVGAKPNIQSNDGYTALHIASEMSEIDFISLLLSYSANKHTIDRRGWNALMVASHENNAAAVTLLLNTGSFPNSRAKDGATALHLACRNLSPDAVCILLAHKNTIPDVYDRFQWTPLMITMISASGSIWFVKKLLEAAINPNFQNSSGATALYIACQCSHTDVVRTLLVHKADPNIVLSDGWSPLMIASQTGDTEIVNSLLIANADVNHQCHSGLTALMLAVGTSHATILSCLLNYGGDPNRADLREWTALMVASLKGNIDITNQLLAAKAKQNIENDYGNTALHIACYCNHPEIVSTLLENGAFVDKQNYKKQTPLMLAAEAGRTIIVTQLLKFRAKPNIKDFRGNTALSLACIKSHIDICSILVSHGSNPDLKNGIENLTPLMIACHQGNVGIVKELVTVCKAYPYIKNRHKQMALHIACITSQFAIVEFLLKLSAVEDHINDYDDNDMTPLALACQTSNAACVRQLLEAKANTGITNSLGMTPLMIAVEHGDNNIVSELLQNGAKYTLNVKNKFGNTALMLAVKHHDNSAVSVLLPNGANPDMPDSDGFTPLMVACKSGNSALVSQLLNKGAEPNVSSPNHQSALDIACYDSNYDMMDLLLEHKADPYFQDNNPLMIVLNKKDATGLQILLNPKYGIDPNLILPSGQTLLHFAAENNWVEVISLLLANGANCDVCGNEGNTPLIIATKNCEMSSVEILLRNGADANIKDHNGDTALHFASSSEIVKLLLTHKAQPNVIDIMGYTPLQRACESGFYNIAIELLHSKADPNTAEGKYSRTPIYITAEKGYLTILTDLLKFGGNPNVCLKSNEWTPLMIASVKGYIDIVNILLVNKAHPNHQAIGGITALHLATKRGFTSIVESLLNAGASPTIVDSNKETPIDIARNEKKMATLQLLMDSNEEELYDSVSLVSEADSSYSSFYDDEDQFTLVSVTTTDSITTVDSGNTPDHPD